MALSLSSRFISRCGRCVMVKNAWTTQNFNKFTTSTRKFIPKDQQRNFSSGSTNPIFAYFKRLKWVPIPVGVGFAYIGYQQFDHVIKREQRRQETADPEDLVAQDWLVTLYRCMPLRILSRAWGRVNDLELPVWMRQPMYKFYIWAFDCNLSEAAIRDLKHYRNLGEFFKRRLRADVRPIDKGHCLTSPSDGRILYFGKVERGSLEQVKGVSYSLQTFLGPLTWKEGQQCAPGYNEAKPDNKVSSVKYHKDLKEKEDTDLYHCVIYLAPGNYHGFHSPCDWTVTHRRHFPGELFSVNPGIAHVVKGLFNFNERATYIGEWEHGFFSLTAVGATNVGSIKIYHDQLLGTNCPIRYDEGCFFAHSFVADDKKGTQFGKGEAFGEFNLGSTIVLVFEAPKTFQFKLEPGQSVKYGEPIGCYKISQPDTGA